MKALPLILLLFITSCGNPHLISKKGLGVNLPLVAQPEDLGQDFNLIHIETAQGDPQLNVTNTNTNTSGSQPLAVNNTNDQEMEISYYFADGTHFQFNGGNFPGTNGTCLENSISSLEKCELDIIFTATQEGVYQDKLIVVFKPKGVDLATKTVEFPLIGERKNTSLTNPAISVKTAAGESSLKYGTSFINEDMTGEVIVKNIGNVDVLIDSVLEKGPAFTIIGGTCTAQLNVGQDCTLKVKFSQNTPGLYSDNIIVTYRPVGAPTSAATQIKTPVYGEKLIKVGGPGPGNPTPGTLIASEVMGDSIDFGTISLGSKTTKQVEITNIGAVSVEIKDLLFNGEASFTFNGGSFPGTSGTCNKIVVSGNCILDIEFKPTKLGNQSGNLVIKTKDGKELTLKLTGSAKQEDSCYTTSEVLLSPVTKAKAKGTIFPYLSKAAGTTSTLSTIYGTEVNGYYQPLDMYTVKDAQVHVQYQLPVLDGKVVSINFGVYVQKVILDNFKDTESLCVSTNNVRKCSGQQFKLESWQKLLNANFWDKYATPVNNRYTEQFNESMFHCGGKECMRLKKVYDLESIFELDSEEMQSVVNDKKVSLIFADDTRMLKLPKLLIKTMKKVNCK